MPLNFDFEDQLDQPEASGPDAKVQVCLMSSLNKYQIHTHDLLVGHLDLAGADKSMLDNLDSWVVAPSDKPSDQTAKHLITPAYVTQIFN